MDQLQALVKALKVTEPSPQPTLQEKKHIHKEGMSTVSGNFQQITSPENHHKLKENDISYPLTQPSLAVSKL